MFHVSSNIVNTVFRVHQDARIGGGRGVINAPPRCELKASVLSLLIVQGIVHLYDVYEDLYIATLS